MRLFFINCIGIPRCFAPHGDYVVAQIYEDTRPLKISSDPGLWICAANKDVGF